MKEVLTLTFERPLLWCYFISKMRKTAALLILLLLISGAVSAGFKGALIVSSIIRGLSLECSVQINAGALQLYSTAKENSSYCCDARPESYMGNTSGVTVSCIYSF